MTDSKKYKLAMFAVLKYVDISADDKLEVLELLMSDRRTALYSEERQEAGSE